MNWVDMAPRASIASPGGVAQAFGQDVNLGLVDPKAFNPGDDCQGGSNPPRP